MGETWHQQFSPSLFMSRVDVGEFINRNEAYGDNLVQSIGKPCILCAGTQGPGLLLNDKSYLCRHCFQQLSQIQYPEKYEKRLRLFIRQREARRLARQAFTDSNQSRARAALAETVMGYAVVSLVVVGLAVFIGLRHLTPLYWLLLLPPLAVACVAGYGEGRLKEQYEAELAVWDTSFPEPKEPELKHFHDPGAELTERDRTVLHVFNHWPGYPPFWGYLRAVVLQRDGDRCQVTGCPSRLSLHVHHRKPVSGGGAHVPENLVSLCDFHHGLEPDTGHERIWGDIKTVYFTLVRAHWRDGGRTFVRPHLRRLQLITQEEVEALHRQYGFRCPSCRQDRLRLPAVESGRVVRVVCRGCQEEWEVPRQLTEETGPALADTLAVSRNRGTWEMRWEMLGKRTRSKRGKWKNKRTKRRRKQLRQNVDEDRIRPSCPVCGAPMRLVRPKRGDRWDTFWGCSRFSDGCRGARPFGS